MKNKSEFSTHEDFEIIHYTNSLQQVFQTKLVLVLQFYWDYSMHFEIVQSKTLNNCL